MSRTRLTNAASWVLGIALLALVVAMIDQEGREQVRAILSPPSAIAWVAITMLARWVQVDILVRPVRALGGQIGKADAFWLGWLRSFLNQILPLSGLAAFGTFLKRRAGMAWGQIAALASPQLLLATVAAAIFGVMMTALNLGVLAASGVPLLLAFAAAGIIAAVVIRIGDRSPRLAPAMLRKRLEPAREAFHLLSRDHALMIRLLALHLLSIVLRAARVWVLFAASDTDLSISLILLLAAVSEVGFLIQLTPGGLGIKEGALVGTAALVGADAQATAAVAVADRILILAITVLMAAPSFWALRSTSHSTPRQG